MSVSLEWPSTPDQVLAWAHVVVAWVTANYLIGRNPAGYQALRNLPKNNRWFWKTGAGTLALGVLLLFILGPGLRLVAPLTAATGSFSLAWGRRLLADKDKKLEAEWEMGLNIAVPLIAALSVGYGNTEISRALLRFPMSNNHIAALLLIGALLILSTSASTHVVRGLLDKLGTIPRTKPDSQAGSQNADTTEYNRGRVIGNLERLFMVLAVAAEAYTALGLLIAAKGLVRIKDLQEREFAEYFLIGTLTSLCLALVLGLLLRLTIMMLW